MNTLIIQNSFEPYYAGKESFPRRAASRLKAKPRSNLVSYHLRSGSGWLSSRRV